MKQANNKHELTSLWLNKAEQVGQVHLKYNHHIPDLNLGEEALLKKGCIQVVRRRNTDYLEIYPKSLNCCV